MFALTPNRILYWAPEADDQSITFPFTIYSGVIPVLYFAIT